jgi:WD40 repeat protein
MERVITFGAEGTICVWQPGSLEQGTITASIGVPVLQCRAEIGMLPNASMNASLASTSAALTRAPCGGSSLKRNKKRGKRKKNGFTASFSSAIFHNNILFAGDNCGGVSVWSGIECNLHWHMDALHGRDQVRWIGYHHDYVVSAGCDGRVLMYQVEHSDSSTDVSAEASALTVTRESAEDSSTSTISAATAKAQEARCVKSCLCELKLVQVRKAGAMTAVEAVSWTVSDNMIAVGFLGNFLLVHNITLQYEVFRQECGGWRRPFDVYLQAMPDLAHQGQATVIYVPTHMQRKIKAKQRKMSAPVLSSRVSSASESHASKPFLTIQVCRRHSRTSSWFEKPSLHGFFHGRVATSVCWLGRISDGEKYIFATGGEDNRVILHMFDPSTRGSRIQHIDSSDVHSSAVIAMCMLPKNGASARPHTLLFTVGGNNMLCCWKIFESGVRPPCLHLLCVHRQRNVMKKGTRIDRARDDCRFMSVAAVPTEKDSNSEIVMCGSSQGTVTVFRLDEDSESLVQLHSFCRKGSACKPILCMGHVSCATSGTMLAHHLLFTGSTDGTVAIWDVSWAVRGRPAPAQGMETLQVLTGVHAMGVNTLHVRTARVEREFDSIWLATGGDDNSIRYSHLALRTLGTITHLSTCAVPQACASALKSVWTDGRRMLAVGWNQRLSVWSIQEQLPQQECKLVHETSCFVHVADASSMDVVTGDHGRLTVVVVGQGVEVVSLLPS